MCHFLSNAAALCYWVYNYCPLSHYLQHTLYRYTVLVTGAEGGLIEPICNAISLHQIKKQNNSGSLLDYFRREFGATNSERFLTAQKNFVHSCAAYRLICYFIRVKDRSVGPPGMMLELLACVYTNSTVHTLFVCSTPMPDVRARNLSGHYGLSLLKFIHVVLGKVSCFQGSGLEYGYMVHTYTFHSSLLRGRT